MMKPQDKGQSTKTIGQVAVAYQSLQQKHREIPVIYRPMEEELLNRNSRNSPSMDPFTTNSKEVLVYSTLRTTTNPVVREKGILLPTEVPNLPAQNAPPFQTQKERINRLSVIEKRALGIY